MTSRLLVARWVVPVSSAPIRDGAVLVSGDRIADVGPASRLARANPHVETIEFPECAITPGLVNAHTHLGLTAASGLLPPDEFGSWLAQVPRIVRAWTTDDVVASAALGALESLQAGVTAVGEIAYDAASVDAVLAAGVGGTFYREVLGIPASQLEAELDDAGFLRSPLEGPRWRAGISPHAPYTSGPGLLAATRTLAARMGLPFAVHVAESQAESALIRTGEGPLASLASRLAPDFEPTGTTPVAYLAALGVLDDAVAVHACETDEADAARLATQARAVVVCPRSNQWLHNRPAPVSRYASLGVRIAVGTDSAVSNENLDVLEDVREVARAAPELSASALLRMVTADAAIAIDVASTLGTLAPGHCADLAVFAVGRTDDPERTIVRTGGRATLDSVMSGGTWRVRARRPLADTSAIVSAADAARSRAEAALR